MVVVFIYCVFKCSVFLVILFFIVGSVVVQSMIGMLYGNVSGFEGVIVVVQSDSGFKCMVIIDVQGCYSFGVLLVGCYSISLQCDGCIIE